MNEKAILGLIGVGGLARKQHLPNLSRMTNVQIKWICDLEESILDNCRRKYPIPNVTTKFREVLADSEVQGVVIATREDMQAALTIEALNAGKNVYVEKPLANTEEECRAVCEAQQKSGKVVMVGFNRRFAPAYGKAKKLIDRNGGAFNIHYRVSDDLSLECYENKTNQPRPWERPAGGRVIYELCHIFDIVSWLSSSTIQSVYCVSCRPDDEIYALTMRSGAVVTIMNSGYASRELPKERLEVIVKSGSLTVEQFVELRTFGIQNEEPVQHFAGHTHPDWSFLHKYLLQEIGMEAVYAMRRIDHEVVSRIKNLVSDVNSLPEIVLDRKQLENSIKAEFPEKQELIDFFREILFFGEYRYNKGWMQAMEAFAECNVTGVLHPQAATAYDGLQSSRAGHAAMESRETGKVIRIQQGGF